MVNFDPKIEEQDDEAELTDNEEEEAKIGHYRSYSQDWYEGVTTPNLLFDELSESQEARIKFHSQYGKLRSWKLARLIVKSGDDLRLE